MPSGHCSQFQVRDEMDWRWQDGLRLRTRFDLLMGHDSEYLFLVP